MRNLIFLFFLIPFLAFAQYEHTRTVTVYGEASREEGPDEIHLSFSFSENEKVKTDTDYEWVEKERKLLELMQEFGMETSQLNINQLDANKLFHTPNNNPSRLRISKNYKLVNRDMTRTTDLIMRLYTIGAESVTITDIKFTDTEKIKKEITAAAAKNAREKAIILADSGNETLGKILSIKEYDPLKTEDNEYPNYMNYARYNATGAVSRAVAPAYDEVDWKKIVVKVTVKVVYELN